MMIVHHCRRAFRVQHDFYAFIFISVVVVADIFVTATASAAASLGAFAHFDEMLRWRFNII